MTDAPDLSDPEVVKRIWAEARAAAKAERKLRGKARDASRIS